MDSDNSDWFRCPEWEDCGRTNRQAASNPCWFLRGWSGRKYLPRHDGFATDEEGMVWSSLKKQRKAADSDMDSNRCQLNPGIRTVA